MLPKSVAPKFVGCAAIPVGIVLSAPVLFFERRLIKDPSLSMITLGCAIGLSHFLVRKVLSCLGIPVRSRSVEQFQAAHRDAKEVAVDLPIQIRYNQRSIRIAAVVIFLFGLGIFLSSIGFLAARDRGPVSAIGVFVMMISLIVGACRQPKICEISHQGIRAPGRWGWLTFVPWEELVRYEIIHDDENAWGDYFVLWDRAERCRFDASSWITNVSRADRARIFRTLLWRFPGKAKADRNAELALLQAASSAVWDRELDG